MEKSVILYTTHCPLCKQATALLQKNGYTINEVTDISLMQSKGFKSVPWIEFEDGTLMNLPQLRQFLASKN